MNRAIVSQGFRLQVRHRTASGYAFADGPEFFEQCGLKRTAGCVPKTATRDPQARRSAVYGRRYAHYLGIIVTVYAAKGRADDEPYHVEFSVALTDSGGDDGDVRG